MTAMRGQQPAVHPGPTKGEEPVKRTARNICLSVAILLGLALDATAEPYRHEPTGIVFPERIAQLGKGEVTDFEAQSAGGGVGVGYNGPKITVTLYAYTFGAKSIPDNHQSNILKNHFKETIDAVLRAGREGAYQSVKKVSEDVVAWDDGGTGRKTLHAQFSYTQGGRDRHSHLYLTGFKNHFIKIRFTYDVEVHGMAEKIQRDFLSEISRMLDAAASPNP
jgi:hypothetical protein